MSKQTVDKSSSTQDIGRVLPPEVEFATLTSSFSGTAKPGLKINLSSSADGQDASVTVGKSGKWKMPLASVPRLYTVFKIWASDDASGAESEKIQFTFGGRNPKLDDVYIGEKAAFGYATPGSDIAIYTSSGKQIALAQPLFDQPFWTFRFTVANRPKAGETLCVIVKNPNGNTSMPHFTQVHAFAIERIGVNGYSGSGAVPGELIQLFDHESGALIDATKASDEGEWAITFANELDFGQRLTLRIVHNDGSVSGGLTTSAATSTALAPSIQAFTSTAAWGFALPGTTVNFWIRDSQSNKWTTQVIADQNASWQVTYPSSYVKPGYFAWVWAAGSTYSYGSQQGQPISPLSGAPLNTPPYNKFATWVTPNYAMTIQTAEGQVYQGQADSTGRLIPPSLDVLGVEPGQVAFFGTSNSSVPGQQNIPTSSYTGIINDTNPYPVPDRPTMTVYQPSLFEGTETTPDTRIDVYDSTRNENALNRGGIPVNGGQWTSQSPGVTIPTPANIGDQVFAEAMNLSSGNIGSTSRSDTYTVGNPASDLHVPIPPQIKNNESNNIYGESMLNTFVTLNLYPYNSQPGQNPTVIGTTGSVTTYDTDFSWQILVDESLGPSGPGQPSLTLFEAYASFPDTSNHSDSYFNKVGVDPGEVSLSKVAGDHCEGTAPNPEMTILGWRSSDGKRIVNYQMPAAPGQSGPTPFSASYIAGTNLPDTDLLNVVAAFSGPMGAMTKFTRKPYGWGA